MPVLRTKLTHSRLTIGLGLLLLVVLISWLGAPPLDQAVSRPTLFWLRDKVAPQQLDSRIKVFALDDKSVAWLGRLDLTLAEWSAVFQALDQRGPAAILVDKMFDKHYGAEEMAAFSKSLRSVRAPIIVGSFFTERTIPLRPKLGATGCLPEAFTPAWAEAKVNFYGARGVMTQSFEVGHAIYNNDGFVRPVVSNGQVSHCHWALLAATTIATSAQGIAVNGVPVPVEDDGQILVNSFPKRTFLSRSIAMQPLISRALKGAPITPVEQGDYSGL